MDVLKLRQSEKPSNKVAWNSSTKLNSSRPNSSHINTPVKPKMTKSMGSSDTLRNSKPSTPLLRRKTSFSPSESMVSLRQQLPLTVSEQFEQLIKSENATDRDLRDSLKSIRRLILAHGIPEERKPLYEKEKKMSLRGKVWKILLGIYKMSALEYMTLVEKGPCPVYEKIKNDTFRTLATDKKFLQTVNESMLTRVLNAFVWRAQDQPVSRLLNLSFSYVQGMNVLAAPFLYVLPELDAFTTFTNFIQYSCPLYVQPALEGVHCGAKLLDISLNCLDPELHSYLNSKKLNATVYAFPSILTFSACTPPLDQVLKLWDFLLAYGVHINIICIISQLILIRNDILKSSSPMKILRTLPELNAKHVIQKTLELLPVLPEDIYDLLARHTFDPAVFDLLQEY